MESEDILVVIGTNPSPKDQQLVQFEVIAKHFIRKTAWFRTSAAMYFILSRVMTLCYQSDGTTRMLCEQVQE